MSNSDFVFNGKEIVNDGVVIKLKLTQKQKERLLIKKKGCVLNKK